MRILSPSTGLLWAAALLPPFSSSSWRWRCLCSRSRDSSWYWLFLSVSSSFWLGEGEGGDREKVNYVHSTERYECVVLQISINFIIELSVQYFHDKHSPAPAGAFSQNLCRISLLPALKSPQWFPSPACEHCPAWFTPSLCLRLVPYEQGAMVEIDRAVLCSNLTASRHGRRQAWLPASDQNNGPSISDGETEVDSSRRAEWWR